MSNSSHHGQGPERTTVDKHHVELQTRKNRLSFYLKAGELGCHKSHPFFSFQPGKTDSYHREEKPSAKQTLARNEPVSHLFSYRALNFPKSHLFSISAFSYLFPLLKCPNHFLQSQFSVNSHLLTWIKVILCQFNLHTSGKQLKRVY